MRTPVTNAEWEAPEDREADVALRKLVGGDAPDSVHVVAAQTFERLQAQVAQRASMPPRRFAHGRGLWMMPAAAALMILVGGWWLFMRSPQLTWADVRASFREAPFFRASIYVTRDPAKPAEHVELWKARDGRVRVHQGGRVFLGENGNLVGVWDATRQEPTDVGALSAMQRRDLHMDEALQLVEFFGRMETFSLDALLAHFCGQKTLSPPLANPEAGIQRDLEVFDVTNSANPEWMRVWALKDAGLPVRIQVMDPRDGDCSEMLFDYSGEQAAEAFDPAAVGAAIQAQPAHRNPLYALIREPGGQPLTPEDLFAAKGYHLPTVVEAGRTEDGLVWVKSGKSENRTADGATFYGFGRLTDDLGQEYLRRFLSHATQTDIGIECFIPLDYSAGYRQPQRYELTCWSQQDDRSQGGDVIGSVALTAWEEGAPLPESLGAGGQANEALKAVIDEWASRENWNRVDALLATIPGDPKDDAMAFYRERTRLKKLTLMKRDGEALALAKGLYETLASGAAENASPLYDVLEEYVKQLIRQKQLEEAQRVLATHRESFQTADKGKMAGLVFVELVRQCRDSGLGQQQVDALFGFPAWNSPQAQEHLRGFPQSGVTCEADPRFDSWRAYAREVAQRYTSVAPPSGIEFPDVAPLDPEKPAYSMSLPGFEAYRIAAVRGTCKELAAELARACQQDPDLAQVAPEIEAKRLDGVVVYPDSQGYKAALMAFLERAGVRIEERQVNRPAWVARYDGRPLPCWLYVQPLAVEDFKVEPVWRGGGSMMDISNILSIFQQAVNKDRTGQKVVIIDETGLPTQPGENQTWGSICLTNQYAFGAGDDATEKAKSWFEGNFGITFTEETRPFPTFALVPGA